MSVCLFVLIYLYIIDKSRHTGKKFVQVEIIKIEPGHNNTFCRHAFPPQKWKEKDGEREARAFR